MTQFGTVALGGTFDIIHKGHLALLSKAFSISSHAIIGLTGDELALKMNKKAINDYSKRFESLTNVIQKKFPNSSYSISKLENDFGPAAFFLLPSTFPSIRSFPVSQFFTSGCQMIGVSVSTSVLQLNIQD